jgi:hypothetical protein
VRIATREGYCPDQNKDEIAMHVDGALDQRLEALVWPAMRFFHLNASGSERPHSSLLTTHRRTAAGLASLCLSYTGSALRLVSCSEDPHIRV